MGVEELTWTGCLKSLILNKDSSVLNMGVFINETKQISCSNKLLTLKSIKG